MEIFSALLAFCAGNSPVNSPHKGQWRGALVFSSICTWINSWVNNGEASDLRRHRAHYDVTVMLYSQKSPLLPPRGWAKRWSRWTHGSTYVEKEMSSFWENCHPWFHWNLAFRQLPAQAVVKISSTRHFRFSVCCAFVSAVLSSCIAVESYIRFHRSTKTPVFIKDREDIMV